MIPLVFSPGGGSGATLSLKDRDTVIMRESVDEHFDAYRSTLVKETLCHKYPLLLRQSADVLSSSTEHSVLEDTPICQVTDESLCAEVNKLEGCRFSPHCPKYEDAMPVEFDKLYDGQFIVALRPPEVGLYWELSWTFRRNADVKSSGGSARSATRRSLSACPGRSYSVRTELPVRY